MITAVTVITSIISSKDDGGHGEHGDERHHQGALGSHETAAGTDSDLIKPQVPNAHGPCCVRWNENSGLDQPKCMLYTSLNRSMNVTSDVTDRPEAHRSVTSSLVSSCLFVRIGREFERL